MRKVLLRSGISSLFAVAAVIGACGLNGLSSAPTNKQPPSPPSVHTISNTGHFSLPEGSATDEVTVACPMNELALGGGYKFEQAAVNGPTVTATASVPFGNGWKVAFLYSVNVQATVSVQCLVGGTGALSVISASLDFPTSTQPSGTGAACPVGSTVVGGGFSVKSGIAVVEDYPTAGTTSGWAGTFKNGNAHDVLAGATVSANCYSLTPSITIVRDHRVQTSSGLYDLNYASLGTGCKAGSSLTAGGYQRSTALGTVITDALNSQSGNWEELLIRKFGAVDVSGLTAVIECVAF